MSRTFATSDDDDTVFALAATSTTAEPSFLSATTALMEPVPIPPLMMRGQPGSPQWNMSLPISTYERQSYSTGIGGDPHSGQGGDSGGYNQPDASDTDTQVHTIAHQLSGLPAWVNIVESQVNMGNINLATQTLFDNTQSIYLSAPVNTSDIGQGFLDIAAGTGDAIVAGAAAAGAVGALATQNYGAAITNAAGAYGAYQASQARYSTQAARDAGDDILQGLYDGLKMWDNYWSDFAQALPIEKLIMRAQADAQASIPNHGGAVISTATEPFVAHQMILNHN